MHKIDDSGLVEFALDLRRSRYKVGLYVGKVPNDITHFANSTSVKLGARYINLTETIAKLAIEQAEKHALGVLDHHDLTDMLLKYGRSLDSPYIVIDNIEPIVATFLKQGAVDFFDNLSMLEPRIPLLVFTYLRFQVVDSGFPKSRILDI